VQLDLLQCSKDGHSWDSSWKIAHCLCFFSDPLVSASCSLLFFLRVPHGVSSSFGNLAFSLFLSYFLLFSFTFSSSLSLFHKNLCASCSLRNLALYLLLFNSLFLLLFLSLFLSVNSCSSSDFFFQNVTFSLFLSFFVFLTLSPPMSLSLLLSFFLWFSKLVVFVVGVKYSAPSKKPSDQLYSKSNTGCLCE